MLLERFVTFRVCRCPDLEVFWPISMSLCSILQYTVCNAVLWNALSPGQTIATFQCNVNATYHNIVGCNILGAFGDPVATCCGMLGVANFKSFMRFISQVDIVQFL